MYFKNDIRTCLSVCQSVCLCYCPRKKMKKNLLIRNCAREIWVQLHVSQVYLSLFPVFFFFIFCYQFFGEYKMYILMVNSRYD